MRTLVYKRTHHGDPDPDGRFGINDCMGRVRGWDYGAVIGVGGIGSEPESFGIAGKITWIGIGPTKTYIPGRRGPIVTFERFLYLAERGPLLAGLAPNLAARIYGSNVRVLLNSVTQIEQVEIDRILVLASDAPPSPASGLGGARGGDCRGATDARCITGDRVAVPPLIRKKTGCGKPTITPPPSLRPRCGTKQFPGADERSAIMVAEPPGVRGCSARRR